MRREIGNALDDVQVGVTPPQAKPLKGFKGVSVLEISEDFRTDTYRAVYTVRFVEAVYVLHCFQKKSKTGIETPKPDKALIESRLKQAKAIHEQLLKSRK